MRIQEKFIELKKRKEGALIGFITAGDPSPEDTIRIAEALIEGGVDILELGLPFSDPIADGPVIQKAGEKALAAGMNTDKFFDLAKKITGVPKACMTYYNLVLQRGLDRFTKDCASSGIDGLIVPDLPYEESMPLLEACRKNDIKLIYFAAPTTTKERLNKTLNEAEGFLYIVSVAGVTGARKELPRDITGLIKRIKNDSGDLPCAVGFGISRPEHVKEIISAGADGAIVGSVFMRIIDENNGDMEKMLGMLMGFASKLKAETR